MSETLQSVMRELHQAAEAYFKTDDIEFRSGIAGSRWYARLFVKGDDKGTFVRPSLAEALGAISSAIEDYWKEDADEAAALEAARFDDEVRAIRRGGL